MKTIVHLDVKEVCDLISHAMKWKFPGKSVRTSAYIETVTKGIGENEQQVQSVRFELEVLEP